MFSPVQRRLHDGLVVGVRRFDESRDPVTALTQLLHRAYAALAAMGFRYLATHQDDQTTLKRVRAGECLLAEMGDAIVGTISWYLPRADAGTPYYRRGDVAHFGQFAVEPAMQGRGIGNILLETAENCARDAGVRFMGLDTAEGATHLLNYYLRHGYETVEHVQWGSTNYRSVVMGKRL